MRKKIIFFALCSLLFALLLPAEAQQRKYLTGLSNWRRFAS